MRALSFFHFPPIRASAASSSKCEAGACVIGVVGFRSHGLYVMDEANVESHAYGLGPENRLANDPAWQPSHVDRVARISEVMRRYRHLGA